MAAQLINNNTESLADFLRHGEVVGSRWTIYERIGSGGFGQVFSAVDHESGLSVAIKAEASNCPYPQLYNEMRFLREFERTSTDQSHQYVPRFYFFGIWNGNSYMVTELCGPNLRTVKKNTPGDIFSPFTSFWIMKQMVNAVKAVHDSGFLHRDVKPANFVIGHSQNYGRRFFIIDFGLVKRKPRTDERSNKKNRFGGTLRYSSLGAQRREDPAASDDLWSVFYITVENICGQLPWRMLSTKESVDSCKTSCHYSRFANIRYPNYTTVPLALRHFFAYLSSGDFETERNYSKLNDFVDDELGRLGIRESTTPLDWENPLDHQMLGVCSP